MTERLRKIWAIVPAAGIGSRMGAVLPKQYLKLQNKAILSHTLQTLIDYEPIEQIVVAVAEQDNPYLAQLPEITHAKVQTVLGGETRADSVLAGLMAIPEPQQTWALVHDAARPCLRRDDLDKLVQIDDEHGGILAVPAVDTIKRAANFQRISHTEDRSQLWLALTPQFFRTDLLINALIQAKEQNRAVTDEASAMELAGFQPRLVQGRADNIKVTRPEDLALAEFYLTRAVL